ncbi:hypothetical protein ACJMK2_041181 [Sinanodonta woodiana]|uniref:Uncharacterized protein n=1 Tax=Sinanodonta woodiana TaxID=1069815 RepID=A0ABD3W551_SINWO
MAPPGPPYNMPPTNEDSRSPNVVPSGQLHSVHPYNAELVATDDNLSMDAMSLQVPFGTEPSSIPTNQNPNPSNVTQESIVTPFTPGHFVQHYSTTAGRTYRGAEGIGTQSSSHDERHQYHTWTQYRQQMMEAVQSTDGNGVQYQIRHGVTRPDMAIYEDRLRTYRRWPQSYFIRPQEAASAGLYCVEGTYVVCFACGGGLDNWDPGDDPMREHARLYKWCPYVAAILVERFLS